MALEHGLVGTLGLKAAPRINLQNPHKPCEFRTISPFFFPIPSQSATIPLNEQDGTVIAAFVDE